MYGSNIGIHKIFSLFFSSSLLLSSLEMSDTEVYEPEIRARLGPVAHFCEVVILSVMSAGGLGGRRTTSLRLHLAMIQNCDRES